MLAPHSVLVLEGPDISSKNLRVDGALVVRAVPGARVVIDGLTVSNKGWSWTPLKQVGTAVVLTMEVCLVALEGLQARGRGSGEGIEEVVCFQMQ